MSLTAHEARSYGQQIQKIASRSFEVIKLKCDNVIRNAMFHGHTEASYLVPAYLFGEPAYERTKAFDALAVSLTKRKFAISTTIVPFEIRITWKQSPAKKTTTKQPIELSALEKARRLNQKINKKQL